MTALLSPMKYFSKANVKKTKMYQDEQKGNERQTLETLAEKLH